MKTSNPVIEELVEELVKKLKAGFSACSQSAGLLLVAFVLLLL